MTKKGTKIDVTNANGGYIIDRIDASDLFDGRFGEIEERALISSSPRGFRDCFSEVSSQKTIVKGHIYIITFDFGDDDEEEIPRPSAIIKATAMFNPLIENKLDGGFYKI